MATPTVRSTTSAFMPSPPGKVLQAGGTFNAVNRMGAAPLGRQQPGGNVAHAGVGAHNNVLMTFPVITG